MQKVQVMYECDFEAAKHDGDIGTFTFGIDGNELEIDLCTLHHDKLAKGLEPFVASARKIATVKSAASRRGASTRTKADRKELAAVRQWAVEAGKQISSRGRIPDAIFKEYAEAHAN